jgi:hypothetical protein
MTDLSPYLEQLSRIAESLLTPEVLLSTGVLTAVAGAVAGFIGRVAWSGATVTLNWLHSWWLRTTRTHTVALARKKLPFDVGILKPQCLIVRYGTDRYLRHLASDREKHDGRLQNRKIAVPITAHPDGSTTFRLRIPDHKRLGTQFKCFVDLQDDSRVAEVLEFLADCQSILSPERSASPLHPNRIYFLVSTFDVVRTIDNQRNNMCFPE